MIDHVKVGVSDLQKAKEFYGKALAPLGYAIHFEAEGVAYFADETASWTSASERRIVPAARMSGSPQPTRTPCARSTRPRLPPGGVDNGAPGLRPEYGPGYYAAYVLDPDGNNIEAKCHEAP